MDWYNEVSHIISQGRSSHGGGDSKEEMNKDSLDINLTKNN